MKVQSFTKDEIKCLISRLSYNSDTGDFTWVDGKFSGKVAGSPCKSGYIRIHVCKKKVAAHRLAWYFCYGNFPKEDIDHINGDKADNRISNLREVSRSQNSMNKWPKETKGVGYYKRYGKWRARIMKEGKSKLIGYFDTFKEAKDAYDSVAVELHGEYSNVVCR